MVCFAAAGIDGGMRAILESGKNIRVLAVDGTEAVLRYMEEGRIAPALIIGVPVGFVNVVASKELIMTGPAPYIVARGRKGGSNVAAAICNALLYQIRR